MTLKSGHPHLDLAPIPSIQCVARGESPSTGSCPSVAAPTASRSRVLLARRHALLCSRDGMLCSSVLRAATKQSGPQLLHKDWKDVQAQEGWILMESFLVHLGYGKFCVAKFFQTVDRGSSEELCQIESFVVLTGLTLQQCGANGELRMIRHRSQLYYFQAMTHCWAF